jgi:hypothetical protein
MSGMDENRSVRLTECLLFSAALFGFAYFHPGGGWSQNVRFAMARAVVEERSFAIDSFLIYEPTASAGPADHFERRKVANGTSTIEGRTCTLAWRTNQGELVPAEANLPADCPLVGIDQVAVSGDLAYCRGHFHPNKAPGTALLAVPGYAILFHLERVAGLDPDGWWALTCNAWLTSVLSVGLVSAIGCVLFYRLAVELSGGARREALCATVAFGAGTLFLPYGTMLHEHNVVAVALLAAFYCLYHVKTVTQTAWRADARLVLAGVWAGYAATCNYVLAVVVLFLGLYLVSFSRDIRRWAAFGAGVFVPFLALCAYHASCFGTPFATNYHFQNPHFQADGPSFLGVFQPPRSDVLLMLLVSPYRGLFFSSPVLVMGVAGWVTLRQSGRHAAEATLFLAIVSFFLLFNCSFNGWPGGWTVGPRYLVPAIPFLALPLVFAFQRFFRTTAVATVLSLALIVVTTAVDPQCPLGEPGFASVAGRPFWRYSPLTEYEIPVFVFGRPDAFLRAQADARFGQSRDEDVEALPMAGVRGPVSVNPQGVYEAGFFKVFPADDPHCRWNSFNAGEFFFPGSRLSLLPLLFAEFLLIFAAWRSTAARGEGKEDRPHLLHRNPPLLAELSPT